MLGSARRDHETQAKGEAMSKLDEALEYFDPGPRARMYGDGAHSDAFEAARAELAMLRDKAQRYDAMRAALWQLDFDENGVAYMKVVRQ